MSVSTSTRPAHRSPLSVAIVMALALSATPAFAADPPAAPAQDGQQADGDKPADKTSDLKAVRENHDLHVFGSRIFRRAPNQTDQHASRCILASP